MLTKHKVFICILGNFSTLVLVFSLIIAFSNNGPYWSFGPNSDLLVLSVKIDRWQKYIFLLGMIMVINVVKVFSEQIGYPPLEFNIWNPDKKIITEFSRNELQFSANAFYFITALRSIFITLVTISQIDVAIWSVLVQETASFICLRILLKEKIFISNIDVV